jgi:4-alpha-glucanotransferase
VSSRRSGLLVPLFSLTSSRSWGIGEFRDLATFAEWARAAGQSFVQILPISEVPSSDTSPYSAMTAMGLDPVYLSLPLVEDFEALGGEPALTDGERSMLERLRAAKHVMYHEVRTLKDRWCRLSYQRFLTTDAASGRRAEAFAAFRQAHAGWLGDFALFQALRARHSRQPWWEWPGPLARREPEALSSAREELAHEIGYRQYVQWLAEAQLTDVRARMRPLQIYGDVPFMISADSPDVWSRQPEFRFDATIGVPPDAFSETGQDWGLPPWRWEVMAENDFEWMRQRAHRTAQLFDGFRLDHLIGLYRMYVRPLDKSVTPVFVPADEPTQTRLGETLVAVYRATDAEVIVEDLGIIPDFVRESLRKLQLPGFKVLRWERRWEKPGQPFVDPATYDERSVATTGTHDTETLASWWESLEPAEQEQLLKLPSIQRHLADDATPRDAILGALLESPSRLTIFPLQDLFGWRDRINTPASVSEENWTWILPWTVDRLHEVDEARARAEALARWTRAARRG